MIVPVDSVNPMSALAGGVLIGLGAALLLWMNGRIAGISGILGGLVHEETGDRAWRAAFVGGLAAGAVLASAAGAGSAVSLVVPLPWLLVGGLFVGFGTRLGNGCTSGHGVCGLGRLSVRSLAATVTFMASGAVTVFVVRQVVAG